MEKSTKSQILREEYPFNLLKAMEAEKTHFQYSVEEITDDKLEGLEYALTELTEREGQILFFRYQDKAPEHSQYFPQSLLLRFLRP